MDLQKGPSWDWVLHGLTTEPIVIFHHAKIKYETQIVLPLIEGELNPKEPFFLFLISSHMHATTGVDSVSLSLSYTSTLCDSVSLVECQIRWKISICISNRFHSAHCCHSKLTFESEKSATWIIWNKWWTQFVFFLIFFFLYLYRISACIQSDSIDLWRGCCRIR